MTASVADAPDAVAELPASAKLIWLHLELHGPMTQKALIEETTLTRRTVRSSLKQLERADAMVSTPRIDDPRQDYYRAVSEE